MEESTEAERADRIKEAMVLLDSAAVGAERLKDDTLLARILVQRGALQQKVGFQDRALTDLLRALDLREQMEDEPGIAEALNSIGSVHHMQGDHEQALAYYTRSAARFEALGLQRELGKLKNNFGALYEDMGQPETALTYHRQSLAIWEELGEPGWMAVSFMHIGTCLGRTQRTDSALHYLQLSHRLVEAGDNAYMQCVALLELGDLFLDLDRPGDARRDCGRAFQKASAFGALNLEKRACNCLYRANEALGRVADALAYHKRFVALRDSVDGRETARQLMRIELGHRFAQQQLADSLANAAARMEAELRHLEQVARQREQRNLSLFAGLGVFVVAIGLWSRSRQLRRSRAAIQEEKDRSEELLLNILPAAVAEELKAKGEAEAKHLDQVTVLFTDFKGFTALSELVTPKELVRDLHECFSAFDAICARHGLEKIKTIGDAYMAAGGLPVPNATHALDVIRAALEMRDLIAESKSRKLAAGRPFFEVRIGIHTGPVVAGIVGVKKFQYDIWGDTVNTASRMESSGEVGQANISEATYALVKNEPGLMFTSRGKVQAKGKGEMEMYFVGRTGEVAQA